MSVAENIAKIEERIHAACGASGRKREDITLMAVSKFQPAAAIAQAWAAGIRVFGESRVQEASQKFDSLRETYRDAGVRLHLIGSLQRNKARDAALLFDCVHSVDRLELIAALGKHAASRSLPLEILLEMRTGEETKRGFSDLDSLCGAAETVMDFSSLRLRGLMTMAPNTADTREIRAAFRRAALMRAELERRFPSGNTGQWDCLSMGMSGDFEIAIEEGASLLRIGSAIFGERQ